MSILCPLSSAGGLPFHFHPANMARRHLKVSRIATLSALRRARARARRLVEICLISPGFNYLLLPPLGRSEGLRVNERRIDTGQDHQVFVTLKAPPPSRPLFAPLRSRGRTECVGSCVPIKWSAGLSKQLLFSAGTGSSLGKEPKRFCSDGGESENVGQEHGGD